jgi:hypothetical protein
MPVEVEQESGRRSVMMRFVFDDITRKKKAGSQATKRHAFCIPTSLKNIPIQRNQYNPYRQRMSSRIAVENMSWVLRQIAI